MEEEGWGDQRDSHPHSGLHRAGCYYYIMVTIGNWYSREDLHLEPPPSQGGVHGSYTSGALRKLVAEAGFEPAVRGV